MTITIDQWILISDVAILLWLMGTWFYEGHHRKCKVDVYCAKCHDRAEHDCQAGKHD